MLAILLADLRGAIDENTRKAPVADWRLMLDRVGRTLEREEEVALVAHTLGDTQDFSYLGHGINLSIAYEGALKLREISYIHAEWYPSGEMKHGPIALMDAQMPVLCIAPRAPLDALSCDHRAAPATVGLSYRCLARRGCGPTKKSGQRRDSGITPEVCNLV